MFLNFQQVPNNSTVFASQKQRNNKVSYGNKKEGKVSMGLLVSSFSIFPSIIFTFEEIGIVFDSSPQQCLISSGMGGNFIPWSNRFGAFRRLVAARTLLEGWDIAYKLKFLIMLNLVADRTIIVPCDIQVDTLPPCDPSG